MTEPIWNVPPEWKVEGGGGGGTGETVSWGDIENKPAEFKPKPHTHKIGDIENLLTSLNEKVDKIEGKGLSQEDFTTELKKKLLTLPSEITEGIVNSVNGYNGHVTITKADIGLENVLNIEQASATELATLEGIVDALKTKIEAMPELPESYVESVNNMTGKVLIDKETIGLGNLTNEKQATKAELEMAVTGLENLVEASKRYSESYADETVKNSIAEHSASQQLLLDKKVDKETGKKLSSNDFTDELKNKLNSIPEATEIVKTVNGITPILNNVSIDKDSIGLSKVENKEYTPLTVFNEHINNKDVHLSDFQRSQLEYLEDDLSLKVDKVDGKVLSSNDFTNEEKEKLANIPNDFKGAVSTVNNIEPDTNGNIEITKGDIGLDNVLNETQATKAEFDTLNEATTQLKGTVSSNTAEIIALGEKIDNIDFPESPVLSVNGKTGKVVVDKDTVGLSNVLNKEQVTKEDFDNFKDSNGLALLELTQTLESYTDKEVLSEANRTNSKLLEKVDKVLGKGLSTNDFTSAYKDKLDNIDTTLNPVLSINTIEPDENGDVALQFVKPEEFLSHTQDVSIHLTSEQSALIETIVDKVDKHPNKELSTNDFTDTYKTQIDTNQKEIETINQKMELVVDTDYQSKELTRELQANRNSGLSVPNLKNIAISLDEPEDKYEGLIWYQIEQ